MLVPLGFKPQLIGLLGGAFIFSCLLGSALTSVVVDRFRCYLSALIVSLIGSVISLGWFAESFQAVSVVAALLIGGLFVGELRVF
jgi:hypothetical protein